MEHDGLRRRKIAESETADRVDAIQKIASLDVFPKVPSDFQQPTKFGAILTVSCTFLILFLVIVEFLHYREPDFHYGYSVDTDHSTKLPLVIDMTVASACEAIGADIVDLVNENIDMDGGLNEEPAYFQLGEEDEQAWQMRRHVNQYISEEYHALHKLLWVKGYRSAVALPTARKIHFRGNLRHDACRIYGVVHVKKMAGNFHILAGKALHGGDLHAHISLFTSESDTNFSHRIERFAFGAQDVAIINPLDGEEKTTNKHSISYQYNLKVVPTDVSTRAGSAMAYQYGVQSMERILNHSTGSHGIPGIFIKYDINPLKISVSEQPVPILHFLVRVCGVVGGIFATTGIVSSLIQVIVQRVMGRFSQRKIPFYKQDSLPDKDLHPSSPTSKQTVQDNALFTAYAPSTVKNL
ncbi:endoplasmic reticulum-Golgi intermediate compartment protein 2-like [Paramacrobiotus metropolitanus]|uniref:endoplasmic reticulum-Golgi intermediate compartment protein 2-like n=1 Tax=Paramacrobiotus metropolitanus TaxID=2943436 RepID=UPI002445BCC4|nr:endoplasmic reticulum-Golgi intermediate compartment protein 2-like [Paramacrobiotus metropolitanus]